MNIIYINTIILIVELFQYFNNYQILKYDIFNIKNFKKLLTINEYSLLILSDGGLASISRDTTIKI